MSQFTERVHIIPTTLDEDQVAPVLDSIPADRVYILHNIESHGLSSDIEDLPLDKIKKLVREKTGCEESDQIFIESIDFYHPQGAMVDIYRIIYTEKTQGNEVIVNLAGGTKPVAIALAFACSFAGTGHMIYVPKIYEKSEEEEEIQVVGTGAYGETFNVQPFEPLNFANIVPTHQTKQDILVGLWQAESEIGITKLLVKLGEISEKPPSNDEQKNERNRIIQRTYRHAEGLIEDGFIEKINSEYRLTDTGRVISQLAEVRRAIDEGNQMKQ